MDGSYHQDADMIEEFQRQETPFEPLGKYVIRDNFVTGRDVIRDNFVTGRGPLATFSDDIEVIEIPAEGMSRPTPPRGRGRQTKWKEEGDGPQSLVGKSWADLTDDEEDEKTKKVAVKDPKNFPPGVQAERVLHVAEDMATVRKFLNSRADVSEAFSPPRVTVEAKRQGLVSGFSLDLTTKDELGASVGLLEEVYASEGLEAAERAKAVHAHRQPSLHTVVHHPKSEHEDARGEEEG